MKIRHRLEKLGFIPTERVKPEFDVPWDGERLQLPTSYLETLTFDPPNDVCLIYGFYEDAKAMQQEAVP